MNSIKSERFDGVSFDEKSPFVYTCTLNFLFDQTQEFTKTMKLYVDYITNTSAEDKQRIHTYHVEVFLNKVLPGFVTVFKRQFCDEVLTIQLLHINFNTFII